MSTPNASDCVDSCKGTLPCDSPLDQPITQSVQAQHSLDAQESEPNNTTTDNTPRENAVNLGQKKRKLTSDVWDYFKRVGKEYAICNTCKSELKAPSKNGTTSLRNHIAICVKKGNQDIVKSLEKQKQLMVQKNFNGKVQFGNFTFDQEKSRKELACAIILHEYPLSIVEHIGFRKFSSSLQPLFKMVSRNTIKKDIFYIYEEEFDKLYQELGNLRSRIAITTDMWTSNQKKGYMSITAHFIDDFWVLQSRILRFVHVPSPHTKEELAKNLIDGLTKWNIETKISTITVDNCSSNDGMISIIAEKLCGDLLCGGKILHMRCAAHILNLVVKDGLTVIEKALSKIRASVAFWSSTPQRVEKFDEMARQLKISCGKKLSLDCKTRWNSTFLMLQTAIPYKTVFPRLKIREKSYDDVPSDQDWLLAEEICEKLEVFFNATELFSGRNYPTTNCFFITMCQLRSSMEEWMFVEDETIRDMTVKMFENFDKYWSVVHTVLAVAVVLDPRYKLKVVEFYFPLIFGDEGVQKEVDRVKQTCYDLVNEYQSKCANSKKKTASKSKVPNLSQERNMQDLVAFLSSSSTGALVKSELDYYLDEPVLPWSQDFDILNWWKTNGIKYPTIQLIARDFLAIPISTVASESAFSTGGRVVSLHRSRLNPNTLEVLMCSQNWLVKATIEDTCSTIESSNLCTSEDDVD